MIGIWGARIDSGGLAWQTLALAKLLNPDHVLVIDSSGFNSGAPQDYTRFNAWDNYVIKGFPTNIDCIRFLNTGVTHVFVCETTYNMNFLHLAAKRGVKVYLQPNAEFGDHLVNRTLPLPYKFILPSPWYLERYNSWYRNVVVLPPPTDSSQFVVAREVNLARKGKLRVLFINGKEAHLDRNGLQSVQEAMNFVKTDIELVVQSQGEIVNYGVDDNRIKYHVGNVEKQEDMYEGFDLMLMPRRYGGLSLPLNEALMSAIPVIMTDVEPNNLLLPKDWLVYATSTMKFMARIPIDVYSASVEELAIKVDEFAAMSASKLLAQKQRAYQLGYDNFSLEELKPKYEELMLS